MTKMFTGTACFSPSVSDTIRTAWVAHGGTLEANKAPSYATDYVFCNGRKDPWYPSLADKVVPVFHAQWVANVVEARFPVPIAPYTLNSRAYQETELLTRDGSTEPVQEYQGEERPAKIAGRSLDEHRYNSPPFEEGHSTMTLVDEHSLDSSKQPGTIPYIDLTKVKTSGKQSREKLRIYVLPQSRPSSSRSRSLSSAPLFTIDGSGIPRVSGLHARKALRHIRADKASFVQHKHRHLGKTFRCGFYYP